MISRLLHFVQGWVDSEYLSVEMKHWQWTSTTTPTGALTNTLKIYWEQANHQNFQSAIAIVNRLQGYSWHAVGLDSQRQFCFYPKPKICDRASVLFTLFVQIYEGLLVTVCWTLTSTRLIIDVCVCVNVHACALCGCAGYIFCALA